MSRVEVPDGQQSDSPADGRAEVGVAEGGAGDEGERAGRGVTVGEAQSPDKPGRGAPAPAAE